MGILAWGADTRFYSTTYMQQVMSHEQRRDADRGEATRVGSFAMLLYSFVAIIAGTVLPYFSQRDERLLPDGDDDEGEVEAARIRETVDTWRRDAHRRGRPLKLPRSKLCSRPPLTAVPFMLRNVWTCALVFFFVLMMSTFAISTVWQATVMISLVGICWAVAMWVPFAIMMEFLRELDAEHDKADRAVSRGTPTATTSPATDARTLSSTASPDERRLLLDRPSVRRTYSAADMETAGIEYAPQGPVAGGTIMGIHNLAIVFPQFLVSRVADTLQRLGRGSIADRRSPSSRASSSRSSTATRRQTILSHLRPTTSSTNARACRGCCALAGSARSWAPSCAAVSRPPRRRKRCGDVSPRCARRRSTGSRRARGRTHALAEAPGHESRPGRNRPHI